MFGRRNASQRGCCWCCCSKFFKIWTTNKFYEGLDIDHIIWTEWFDLPNRAYFRSWIWSIIYQNSKNVHIFVTPYPLVRQISRHKKRAPERHVYFYYYNPLDQGQVINCQIYDHVFFTSVVTPAGLNKLNNDLF